LISLCWFVGLKITEEVVGHKFGEFAFTRKPFSFGKRASTSKTHFLWEKSFGLEDDGYYDVKNNFLKLKI
jgi:hypothetical protein